MVFFVHFCWIIIFYSDYIFAFRFNSLDFRQLFQFLCKPFSQKRFLYKITGLLRTQHKIRTMKSFTFWSCIEPETIKPLVNG